MVNSNINDYITNNPIKQIHKTLIALFVDRFEVETKLFNESKKQWFDELERILFSSIMHYERCFWMHKEWNVVERMATANDWENLFIEDGGINNAW